MQKEADKVKEKSLENKDFWGEYRAVVLVQGIPETRAEWYVKWVQKFARFVRGVPLRVRTAEHVRAFLNDLRHQVNMEKWQLDQAVDALRILYQKLLNLAWAQKWQDLAGTMPQEGLPQNKLFRDGVNSKEVDALHEKILKQLRTEIRVRHYSLSTERTYEDWCCFPN